MSKRLRTTVVATTVAAAAIAGLTALPANAAAPKAPVGVHHTGPAKTTKHQGVASKPNPITNGTPAQIAAALAKAKAFKAGTHHGLSPRDSNAGNTISRSAVLARAEAWVAAGVQYSEDNKTPYTDASGTYRRDCSGFISMAWDLQDSAPNWGENTATLPNFATELSSLDDLQPGDMIDNISTHVVLFKGWTDSSHTTAEILEEPHSGLTAREDDSFYTRSYLTANGFLPYRYNNIANNVTHDATGDGKSDLMIYEPDGTIQMGVGTGDGFTNYHEISGGWGGFDGRLHFADVTGDGKADLLIYEPDGTIQMGVGTGNGFTNYHQISSGWGGYDGRIQFADINGDGKADMLIFQPDGTLTVGISNGNGFTNYHEISSGWSTYYPRIQFADVTGDGKADILIYEPDGTIQMGVGTGDGFTNYHQISSGWGGYDGKIKFGDVTGDGKADMEIIQPNGDMTLGVSNGNGFTDYHTISGGWSTFAARLQLA
ncbi:FG-GAP repeat domain-containing protein [Streptacidiphilus sp. MAP12-33]|uniref:FG-GAP repeat domain-containing protein n=1 Tax=Streptacidiphilus sp. MAP12-33 TaxID=3156266 RepID=UPI0035183049